VEKVTKSASGRASRERTAETVKAARQRRLAAFYTPARLTASLVKWAIRDPGDTILDPSCGGCAFLGASADTLRSLGSRLPEEQLFGIDIDPTALKHVRDVTGGRDCQFVRSDFFAVTPSTFGRTVKVIVGNPPYLRPSQVPRATIGRMAARLAELQIPISRRASLWAPFTAYATYFLEAGGRMGFVLPGAVMHTHYGEQLLTFLRRRFGSVALDTVQERLFEDTDERSVLLQADNFGGKSERIYVRGFTTLAERNEALSGNVISAPAQTDRVVQQANQLVAQLTCPNSVIRLGEVSKISIGLVTGANRFFVLTDLARRALGITLRNCEPVVRKPMRAPGLSLTLEDLAGQPYEKKEHLIVVENRKAACDDTLKKWIRLGHRLSVPQRFHCRNRESWYALTLPKDKPEAFLCPMGRDGPRVVVNSIGAWCTNNIFALKARNHSGAVNWDQLAVGAMSSLTQLSAELLGRTYGGGILKLEPSEAVKLLVPLLSPKRVASIKTTLDVYMRAGKRDEARLLVDSELTTAGIIPDESCALVIREALAILKKARQPLRLSNPGRPSTSTAHNARFEDVQAVQFAVL
jgi:adenine-specific DNA-methyltransferase